MGAAAFGGWRVCFIQSSEYRHHFFSNLSGSLNHMNACCLQGCHLFRGGAVASGDDRSGVTHASSWRRGLSGNETDDRLVHVGFGKLSSLFFRVPADFPVAAPASSPSARACNRRTSAPCRESAAGRAARSRFLPAIPVQFPWDSRAVPVEFPCSSRARPRESPARSRRVPVQFPASPRSVPVEIPFSSRGIPVQFPWNSRAFPVEVPASSRGGWLRMVPCGPEPL